MTINPSLFCIYIELPWQHTWHVIGSSGGGSDVLRWMVCERGRWCLSRSCGEQPRRDVTRLDVMRSLSFQNNTRNQLLLWESLQNQGPDWEPVYSCIVQPCPGRTYTHTHTHTVPSLVYQASSSVFAACLLLSLSTQLLTSPLSTVTTKPSELFLKVWTKRSDLHFFCCCCCFLWLLSHSLFSYRPFRTVHKYDKRYPKISF